MTPRHPRGEAVGWRVGPGVVLPPSALGLPEVTGPAPRFVVTGVDETSITVDATPTATTVLRGTGTRFDLVTVPPRGLPPYTPTDLSPARVGRPED